MSTTDLVCDYCHATDMEAVYTPIGTKRGACVMVCQRCGLVQTRYDGKFYAKHKDTSASASWGNIRYGKILSLPKHITCMDSYCRSIAARKGKFLDIGSSRGAFVDYVCALDPALDITAIEPDATVLDSYIHKENVHFFQGRLEDYQGTEKFDFMYSSHTLEHADSAQTMISRMAHMLKDEGYIFLACPSLLTIRSDIIAEEFFLDKHTYHFSPDLLKDILLANNLKVIDDYSTDGEIIFVCALSPAIPSPYKRSYARLAKEDIKKYAQRLQENRLKFIDKAQQLTELSKKYSLVIWGAGRIFYNLLTIGKCNPSVISRVVDSSLPKYVQDVQGIAVHFPDSLQDMDKETTCIVVCSYKFYSEIAAKAQDMGFTHIKSYLSLEAE